MSHEPNIVLHPTINLLQKLVVYDLKDWLYIVGSNNEQSVFRLLRISRSEPRELVIKDDGKEYTTADIQSVIHKDIKGSKTTLKTVSAFGIVGFVRFMEGYYIILITKRSTVAAVGLHYIYKIANTTMLYIPNETVRQSHSEEQRYLKIFQSIDLSSNFYFSYSYDITNTLQVNTAVPKSVPELVKSKDSKSHEFQIRSRPNRKFVWNDYLISGVENELHPDWVLYMTHGFVGQSVLSMFGRSVFITLVARRSNKYAGTRFLKRGANMNGDVANEVETEQIVEDMGVSSWIACPRISSFVQIRGSIPGHWNQEVTKIVTKPHHYRIISYHLPDPFVETPAKHFTKLFENYGSPIIVLNLVKQREKKRHESTLSAQYLSDIKYLNQFLPPAHSIQYVSFDMARKNKGSKANVLGKLAKIAEAAVAKTGVFIKARDGTQYQTGVIRVNCVDCLDRTNTAQFALGKYALAIQLSKLGLFGEGLELDFDCDCTRLLEVLYEDHGDTLALQYGGSQLVHRIKTYRKTAPWTSQGNDIMQSLSRYYSNTFSDAEKQNAMNLFLGLFIPGESEAPLWESTTDFYLHNPITLRLSKPLQKRLPLTQWWGDLEIDPLATSVRHRNAVVTPLIDFNSSDTYSDYHRPHETTALNTLFTFTMSHTVRDFAPSSVVDVSPFTVRIGRQQDDGKDRSSSQYSSNCNSSSDSSCQESDEEEIKTECSSPARPSPSETVVTPQQPRIVLKQPSFKDTNLYKRYVVIEKQATLSKGRYTPIASILTRIQKFKLDSSYEVQPPTVSPESIAVYSGYVNQSYDDMCACLSTDQAEKYARYRNNQLFVYTNT